MTIAEIISMESARQDAEQFNLVHFVKEGNGFYRAHDWSAWLLKAFPPNDLVASMGVTAKRQKDGYVDAFVGFPATSLKKYIPEAEPSGFTMIDDNHFTVTVEIPAEIGEVSFDNLNRMKEEWKQSLPLQDKKKNCVIVGSKEDWTGLDPAKSMLNLMDGLGLPIGNLTSQLFSNVHLNAFDQFMKRVLGCKYYGRYVDDAAVVSADKEWLLSLVPRIRGFLKAELGLELHMGKLEISEVHHGVEFLGAYIKPYRTYISNHALRRMERKIAEFDFTKPWKVIRSVNSYLGIFIHTASFRLRRKLLMKREILGIGIFDKDMTKFTDRKIFYEHLKHCDYEQDSRKEDRVCPYQGGRKPCDRKLRLSGSRRRERHMDRDLFLQEAGVADLPF